MPPKPKQPKLKESSCRNCDTVFTAEYVYHSMSYKKFCSVECYRLHRSELKRLAWTEQR